MFNNVYCVLHVSTRTLAHAPTLCPILISAHTAHTASNRFRTLPNDNCGIFMNFIVVLPPKLLEQFLVGPSQIGGRIRKFAGLEPAHHSISNLQSLPHSHL
jgi:hypothetical protein